MWHSLFGLCLLVFSPQPLCVRLRQRHFTHGRQQLNIVFYVSACQGRWIFIACSELKADKQPYHMICLINGPHQLLANYIWAWMGKRQWVCVCESPEHVTIWLCSFVFEDWREKQQRVLGWLFPQQMNSRCLWFTLRHKTSISWELGRCKWVTLQFRFLLVGTKRPAVKAAVRDGHNASKSIFLQKYKYLVIICIRITYKILMWGNVFN